MVIKEAADKLADSIMNKVKEKIPAVTKDEDIEEAEREAKELKREAEEEAREIREEAKRESEKERAKEIEERAREEAKEIRQKAKKEAEEIREKEKRERERKRQEKIDSSLFQVVNFRIAISGLNHANACYDFGL